MADEEARFRLVVESDGGDTDGLASSLQSLRDQIAADKEALSGMTSALRAMKAGGMESSAAFGELRAQIDAQKASLAGATANYVELGGAFGPAAEGAEEMTSALEQVGDAAEEAGDKVGAVGDGADQAKSPLEQLGIGAEAAGGKLGELKGKLTKLAQLPGPVLVVAAVVALTVALIAGAVALTAYALKAANAARDQGLMMEAFEKTSPALAGVGKSIASVHDSTGVATDKLKGLAKELQGAKVSAKDMPAALKAMAQAEAALGEGGAAEFMQQLKDGKKTVAELSKEIDSKFGSIVKQRMLGLDQQFAKAKENVGQIFSGVKIDGFLEGLRSILSMLDANTASGRALRRVATIVLQPLIDAATALLPIAKGLFQGMVIGILYVVLYALKLKNALRDTFGGDTLSGIDGMKTAMYAGIVVIGLLVAALMMVGVVALIAFAPLLIIGALVAAAIYGVSAAIDWLSEAFSGGAGSAVSALISGLVDGIASGAGAVGSAMMSLASSAIAALMAGFDAHSPSRKTKKVGGFAGQGVAVGAEEEQPKVAKAMKTLVEIPSDVDPAAEGRKAAKGTATGAARAAQSEGGSAAPKGGSSGGDRKVEVTFNGVPGAKEMMTDAWLDKACSALEAALARGGIAVEPEGATA